MVVVEAPTGSGKSTRIPIRLENIVEGLILVVQPRRVAARSLAQFLSSERGQRVGESIGFRIRFDDHSSRNTRVLFATLGVALRMLRENGGPRPGAVILDEFHEGGLEADLCAAILLEARRKGHSRAPIVLTSATLDGQALADQIGGVRLTAEGRTYPSRSETSRNHFRPVPKTSTNGSPPLSVAQLASKKVMCSFFCPAKERSTLAGRPVNKPYQETSTSSHSTPDCTHSQSIGFSRTD